MASIRVEPCDWPLAYCGGNGESSPSEPGVCSTLSGLDSNTRLLVERAAITYLWNWTGRQFGTCAVTIRPCRDDCSQEWTTYRGMGRGNAYLPWTQGGWGGPLNPALINGQWYNLGCGGSCGADKCSCSYVPTVTLAGPVVEVTQVRVNGNVLDPTAYRLDNHAYLVRTDGDDWPSCQNMLADPATDDDTFEVTYVIGVEVPPGGELAAGVLACEMAKAACNSSSCRLPQRIQSFTRQGVTMTVLDNYDTMYKLGTTGLWVVDSWIASINSAKARAGIRIASPDIRPTRRTT